jgi:hypothetical protein
MANPNRADLRSIKILEVHLDATKLDEFTELRHAPALAEFQPRHDGANPHDLQAICLVVKGNLLFMRYSYHLASPVMSHLVGERLKKLLTGTLTEKEEAGLPYKINSTEKGLSKALLSIRGIKKVIIEGRGTMEGDFAETVKATSIQPPGTSIVEMGGPGLPASTHWLNDEGQIRSKAYGAKAYQPYLTRPLSPVTTSKPSRRVSGASSTRKLNWSEISRVSPRAKRNRPPTAQHPQYLSTEDLSIPSMLALLSRPVQKSVVRLPIARTKERESRLRKSQKTKKRAEASG